MLTTCLDREKEEEKTSIMLEKWSRDDFQSSSHSLDEAVGRQQSAAAGTYPTTDIQITCQDTKDMGNKRVCPTKASGDHPCSRAVGQVSS